MDTLIELFDKETPENIYGVLAFCPKRVIYLGDDRLMTLNKQKNIRLLFEKKGIDSEIKFISIRTDDIEHIRSVFLQITESYPNFVCDVTGGTDLLLVTIGMLCHEKKIPAFFIQMKNGQIIPLNQWENTIPAKVPSLSVEDLMILAGGYAKGQGHYSRELDEKSYESTILKIWELARMDLRLWGNQVQFFQRGQTNARESLEFHAPVHLYDRPDDPLHCSSSLLRKLEELKVIRNLRMTSDNVSFVYSNQLYRHLLCDAGVWLELFVYYAAKRTEFFDDVKVSVIVDWVRGADSNGTTNEIDGIVIKGMSSLFISCKLSSPSVMALTEIETLTKQFGGSLATPVLITGASERDIPFSTRQRASDMGIRLISIFNQSIDTLGKTLKDLF